MTIRACCYYFNTSKAEVYRLQRGRARSKARRSLTLFCTTRGYSAGWVSLLSLGTVKSMLSIKAAILSLWISFDHGHSSDPSSLLADLVPEVGSYPLLRPYRTVLALPAQAPSPSDLHSRAPLRPSLVLGDRHSCSPRMAGERAWSWTWT